MKAVLQKNKMAKAKSQRIAEIEDKLKHAASISKNAQQLRDAAINIMSVHKAKKMTNSLKRDKAYFDQQA